MSRSRQRIHEYSSQKYRKTKLSQPAIVSKNTMTEKIRGTRPECNEFYDDLVKMKTILPRVPPSRIFHNNADITSSSWCLYDSRIN